jgi:hypothetical protein
MKKTLVAAVMMAVSMVGMGQAGSAGSDAQLVNQPVSGEKLDNGLGNMVYGESLDSGLGSMVYGESLDDGLGHIGRDDWKRYIKG